MNDIDILAEEARAYVDEKTTCPLTHITRGMAVADALSNPISRAEIMERVQVRQDKLAEVMNRPNKLKELGITV